MIMQEYNGWTNFPTWSVFTWINDNPVRQAYGRTIACSSDLKGIEKDDLLKEWVESKNPLRDAGYEEGGTFSELVQWGLGNVNWTEIEKALEEK